MARGPSRRSPAHMGASTSDGELVGCSGVVVFWWCGDVVFWCCSVLVMWCFGGMVFW